MTLSISFASLVKYNNGEFKSTKQSDFLLSKCIDNAYHAESNNTYNNITRLVYICDVVGVKEVLKISQTKNTNISVWVRSEENKQKSAFNVEFKNTGKVIAKLHNTNQKLANKYETSRLVLLCGIKTLNMDDTSAITRFKRMVNKGTALQVKADGVLTALLNIDRTSNTNKEWLENANNYLAGK
jgi:hypothetical protein